MIITIDDASGLPRGLMRQYHTTLNDEQKIIDLLHGDVYRLPQVREMVLLAVLEDDDDHKIDNCCQRSGR